MFYSNEELFAINVFYQNRLYRAIYDQGSNGMINFRTQSDIEASTYLEVREVGENLLDDPEMLESDTSVFTFTITTSDDDEENGYDVYKDDISALRVTRDDFRRSSLLTHLDTTVQTVDKMIETKLTVILDYYHSSDETEEWDIRDVINLREYTLED